MASTLTRTLIDPVRDKIVAGERLDFDDGVALLECDDLLASASSPTRPAACAEARDEVFFVNNLYLNHTTSAA